MKQVIFAIAVITAFVACNNAKNQNVTLDDRIGATDTSASNASKESFSDFKSKNVHTISSKAAVITAIDSSKKFIRTAQIKSKVANVLKATVNIEDATVLHGGFVTSSLLQSYTNKVEQIEVSDDSLMEQINYTTTNTISCRVPSHKLDTFLKDVAKNVVFIDYRNIKTEDVTIDFIKNNLIEKRTEAYKSRMNKIADDNTSKPADINNIAEGIISKQEQQDIALMDILNKKDAITYSSITIEIYQPEAFTQHLIANTNSKKYTSSFLNDSYKSIKKGWFYLLQLLSFIIQLWPLILLSVITIFGYKKYFKKL